jgi:hypothetical protein
MLTSRVVPTSRKAFLAGVDYASPVTQNAVDVRAGSRDRPGTRLSGDDQSTSIH